jgi:hypothetical protein
LFHLVAFFRIFFACSTLPFVISHLTDSSIILCQYTSISETQNRWWND